VVTGNNNGRTLPDKYVNEILLRKIDEASAMDLLMNPKQDPNLSWREYFNELSQNFAVDDKLKRRNRWRKVILQRHIGKMMMAKWRLFKVILKKSLERWDAPNEHDLRDHILEQLPPKLR